MDMNVLNQNCDLKEHSGIHNTSSLDHKSLLAPTPFILGKRIHTDDDASAKDDGVSMGPAVGSLVGPRAPAGLWAFPIEAESGFQDLDHQCLLCASANAAWKFIILVVIKRKQASSSAITSRFSVDGSQAQLNFAPNLLEYTTQHNTPHYILIPVKEFMCCSC
ncbi:hypothetical protein Ahy_B09g094966 [Arachis hypogaea]|uniref:Uncharacterized protein n=1 Tax=Arachis hypogaea TaxID=3818 RepID=A0A444XCL0_ARAHY|nr:hypothetical protein Ahy_B09g094966 [Arachis hypogaea]